MKYLPYTVLAFLLFAAPACAQSGVPGIAEGAFGAVQLGLQPPPFIVDPITKAESFNYVDYLLDYAGTASVSPNQWEFSIQGGVDGLTNSLLSYEKAGLMIEMGTKDAATPSIFRGIVGADVRGIILGSTATGQAWGITPQCTVNPPGNASDGYCTAIEAQSTNFSGTTGAIGTATEKTSTRVLAAGSAPSTAGFEVSQGGGQTFKYGLVVEGQSITAGGFAFTYFNPANSAPLFDITVGGIAEASNGGVLRVAPAALSAFPACAAGTEGSRATQNNSTAACSVGATATSAGTTHCEIYCNGTNWVQTGL